MDDNNIIKPLDTIISAIKTHSYNITSVVDEKEDGILLGKVLGERAKQIQLLKLCKFLNIPAIWQYHIYKLNQLMCLRVANDLGVDTKTVATTYFLKDKAAEIDLGKTPTSNNALCKMMQSAIDEILYIDDGKGKNLYKVNSHDVAYMEDCYTSRGKEKLTVKVAKDDFVIAILVDIMHRLLTNGKYSVDGYKKKK